MPNVRHQAGFTLIEALLYIGLFVILIGAVLVVTYQMIEATDKAQYRSLIHNEAQFGIRKMHWLLNGATAATVSSGNLEINNPDLSSDPIVLRLDGSKLAMDLDGDTIPLTGDIAPVTQLTFQVTPVAGTPPAEVQMQIRMQNVYYDETFTAKKLLR